MSEPSSLANAWHPGGNPKLTAVPLAKASEVSKENYLGRLEARLAKLLVDLGSEKEARALVSEWWESAPELVPLESLPVNEWPEFLAVKLAPWGEAGLSEWPRKASPSPEASKALRETGLREWLQLRLPRQRED